MGTDPATTERTEGGSAGRVRAWPQDNPACSPEAGPDEFATRLEDGDLSLFEAIASQTSLADRASLLACQAAVRRQSRSYCYLEIGSHLGGSLQPHMLDPRCRRIYSIDKRVATQPDARGTTFVYRDNSTARMRQNLRAVSPRLDKLTCIDGDSCNIQFDAIDDDPDLYMIDGEHTDAAVAADFDFCLRLIERPQVGRDGVAAGRCARAPRPAAVVFHDADVVYNALASILERLRARGAVFHAYNVPHTIFVIEFNGCDLHRHPSLAGLLLDNHVGYLASLQANDRFRRFANRRAFRFLRRLRATLR